SRRRHTRSKRDWSSDVCSSDLAKACFLPPEPTVPGQRSAGAVTGADTLQDCLEQGINAATEAVREAGFEAGDKPELKAADAPARSEEHTSELQSRFDLVCRLLL